MAVPFRRTSKTKKNMRRTHLKKEVSDWDYRFVGPLSFKKRSGSINKMF